jgi:hypothetical protein
MCFGELAIQGCFIVRREMAEQFFVNRLQRTMSGAEMYFGG